MTPEERQALETAAAESNTVFHLIDGVSVHDAEQAWLEHPQTCSKCGHDDVTLVLMFPTSDGLGIAVAAACKAHEGPLAAITEQACKMRAISESVKVVTNYPAFAFEITLEARRLAAPEGLEVIDTVTPFPMPGMLDAHLLHIELRVSRPGPDAYARVRSIRTALSDFVHARGGEILADQEDTS